MSKNIKLLTDLNTPIIADSSSNDLQLNGKGLKVKTGESTSKQVIETDGTLTQVNALDLTDVQATTDTNNDYSYAVVSVTQSDGQVSVTKGKISASGIAGVGVTIDEVEGTGDVLKQYKVYQGGTQSQGTTTGGTLVGTINIPKDFLVKSGEVKTVTTADQPYSGAVVGDKYIDLVLNVNTGTSSTDQHVYIPVKDLVDVYTAAQNAAEVQLAINASNVISATIVKVGGAKVELTKIDGSTTITAQSAYAAMNATTTASTASEDTSAIQGISVVTGVTQVDGVVSMTSAKADKYGSATKALNDAKSYVDNGFKPLQTAVTDPTASGNATSFIDSVSQNASGVITATKKTIPTVVASTSGTGGSAGLMTAAQAETLASLSGDFDSKADKVSSATSGNFAGLDANGNLTDSGKKAADFATATQGGKADTALQSITKGTDGDYVTTTVGAKGSGTSQSVGVAVTVQAVSTADTTHKGLAEASDVKSYISNNYQPAGNYKTTQTAVTDPTASGNTTSFIDSISQDTNGVITASKKTVQSASDSQAGLMSASDFTKLSGIESGAQVNVIEEVQFNGTALTPTSKSVNVQAATTTQGGYADSALQSITKGTESNYATVTIGTKTGNNGAKTQTIDVSNTIQAVSTASSSAMGLAEASDVKAYVDAKVYVDAQGAHIAFGNGYTLDITTEGAISATVPTT